jgi:hypothetical protein
MSRVRLNAYRMEEILAQLKLALGPARNQPDSLVRCRDLSKGADESHREVGPGFGATFDQAETWIAHQFGPGTSSAQSNALFPEPTRAFAQRRNGLVFVN